MFSCAKMDGCFGQIRMVRERRKYSFLFLKAHAHTRLY